MQNKLLPVLIAATALTCGAWAQETIATPTLPAPAVQQPAATAVAPIQAAPTPNQVIYAPRLPSAAELANAAAAQGLTVEQINQTASQVTVIYRHPSGQTNTVAYQLLPTAGATTTTTVVAPAPAPAPTVVYETAPSVIYYESYRPYPYWPRYYYPPVSLNLGFGYYRGGWGHGGWGGGHHWR